ncbi:2TM domain-containing protein [Zunongwangia sp. F363]|uniref:2TM domain-containing protein n=1 Tax=Autumnicola tepida TaxID=3075595 RepID=A0ABU3CA66_9FLAO|nr:2TM domain-containing protein [Zunongwangia sp. F363]MDT0643232.1 2TM domain-containing protein [Zunongwangia sp. F363]
MMKKTTDNIRYHAVRKRVRDIRGFYLHLMVYLAVNIMLFILVNTREGFWGSLGNLTNYSTAFFWGIGLFAHWFGVFGSGLVFGKNWEEKKIRELMRKEERKTWE